LNLKQVCLLLLLSLAACQAPAVKKYPYLVKVKIKGCEEGNGRLFRPNGHGLDLLDSVGLKQGKLVFKGMIAHPGVYSLFCNCGDKITSNLEIYLPADSVDIAVTPGANLHPAIYQPAGAGAHVVGSYLRNTTMFSTARQQREVASFLRTRDSLWNKYFLDMRDMATKMNKAIGAGNKPEIDRWADSTRRVQEKFPDYFAMASEQFVKQHPHSEAALFALLDAGDARVAIQRLRPYYQALPDSVKTSYFGQILGKRLASRKQ
ncbi:MAG: DUF4369 domain-containing protein, partial [Hymenobacter sp.]